MQQPSWGSLTTFARDGSVVVCAVWGRPAKVSGLVSRFLSRRPILRTFRGPNQSIRQNGAGGSIVGNLRWPLFSTQENFRLYNLHISLMVPFGCYTPKHHIVYHLLGNLWTHGSPNMYANWVDEALNRTLKQVCKNVAQRCFDTTVLLRMRDILSSPAGVKRSRDRLE